MVFQNILYRKCVLDDTYYLNGVFRTLSQLLEHFSQFTVKVNCFENKILITAEDDGANNKNFLQVKTTNKKSKKVEIYILNYYFRMND